MKFNIGKRVKVISDEGECRSYVGKTATVVIEGNGASSVGIELDEKIGMHDCSGKCKDGYGYYAHSWNLQLISNNQSIHIYRHDNEVIATLKSGEQTVKSAKAKCNPSDTFDFNVGAKLAFTRLMGEELAVKEIEAVDKPLTADGFKVGDRVEVVEDNAFEKIGSTGTIDEPFTDGYYVKFDDGKRYWLASRRFKLLSSKPTSKEVHRPAEVGEWVKAVNPDECGYENSKGIQHGQAYLVKSIGASGDPMISTSKDDCCTLFEYVVLENYQPEEPKPMPSKDDVVTVAKPFVKARVGDRIEIVNDEVPHGPKVNKGDIFIIDSLDNFGVSSNDNWFKDTSQEYIILDSEEAKPCNKVSRRAEAGEWVEIIMVSDCGGKDYKVGDIIQIVPTNRSTGYPYYRDEMGKYLYDYEYLVLENFNPNNLPSTEKPDISILDNFTFEEIAKYLFHKVGDGK